MDGNIDMSSVNTVASAAGSGLFATVLQEGCMYVVVATVASWIVASPSGATAATAHGTTAQYVPPNYPVVFKCPAGTSVKVAIIADSTAGFASLSLVNG